MLPLPPVEVANKMLTRPGLRMTARQRKDYKASREAHVFSSPIRKQDPDYRGPILVGTSHFPVDGGSVYTTETRLKSMSLPRLLRLQERLPHVARRVFNRLEKTERLDVIAQLKAHIGSLGKYLGKVNSEIVDRVSTAPRVIDPAKLRRYALHDAAGKLESGLVNA